MTRIASRQCITHSQHRALFSDRGRKVTWRSNSILTGPITYQEESDLWALPMRTGLLHSARKPVRLTAGPLFYSGARPSRDGKQVFAIGTKRRGELVRYDLETHQFVPFLRGISAIDPTFSRDGQWVAYTSYPDHTLWRSRSDGTERRQLTYPPREVGFPFISPDGSRVAFMTSHWDTYVISTDGGTPQRVVARDSAIANWSTDGDLLVFYSVPDVAPGGTRAAELKILDLRTGGISVVPSSQHMVGAYWIMQDELVAANEESTKLLTFDFKTQKWTEIANGTFANWNVFARWQIPIPYDRRRRTQGPTSAIRRPPD